MWLVLLFDAIFENSLLIMCTFLYVCYTAMKKFNEKYKGRPILNNPNQKHKPTASL